MSHLRIYTDGSWHPLSKYAGCGIVMVDDIARQCLFASVYLGRLHLSGVDGNHAAELAAAAYALEWMRPGVSGVLTTDYSLTRRVLRHTGHLYPPALIPWVERLRRAAKGRRVRVQQVRSHTESEPPGMTEADRLAKLAMGSGKTAVWTSSEAEEQAA